MMISDFDRQHYLEIDLKRQEHLEKFLRKNNFKIRTILDLGAGQGSFSRFFDKKGYIVTAIDARKENINRILVNQNGIKVIVYNAEDPSITKLGTFDAVFCYGLLYHLENPIAVIRNIFALTKDLAFICTKINNSKKDIFTFVKETQSDSQGLHYIALTPSYSVLIKLLYLVGFYYVYRYRNVPNHPDFINNKRVALIASKNSISSQDLLLIKYDKSSILSMIRKLFVAFYYFIKSDKYRFRNSVRGRLMNAKIFPNWLKKFLILDSKNHAGGEIFLDRIPFRDLKIWYFRKSVIGEHLYYSGSFEDPVVSLFKTKVKPGSIVLDIGANIGYHSLILSRLAGREGRVYSFEPFRKNFELLSLNKNINNCDNLFPFKFALGDKLSDKQINICADFAYNSLLKINKRISTGKKEMVHIDTIDHFLTMNNIEKVNLIKIDVEGYEYFIIKGAKKILSSKQKPHIICEIYQPNLDPLNIKAKEVIDYILSFGYEGFKIEKELIPIPRTEKKFEVFNFYFKPIIK